MQKVIWKYWLIKHWDTASAPGGIRSADSWDVGEYIRKHHYMPHLVLCSSLGVCCLLLSENSGSGALLFCPRVGGSHDIFLYKASIEYWEKDEVGFIICSVLPTVCSNCLRQPQIRVQTSHALVTSNHWAGSKHRRVPTTRHPWGGNPASAAAALVLYAAFSVLLVSSVWGHTNWSATARAALACPRLICEDMSPPEAHPEESFDGSCVHGHAAGNCAGEEGRLLLAAAHGVLMSHQANTHFCATLQESNRMTGFQRWFLISPL